MQSTDEIRVWDPLVRIFHWTLVIAFAAAYFSEDDLQSLHVVAGYSVLGLLVFRLAWGLIGTRHARFSDFVQRPRVVIAYLKDILWRRPKRYIGHNPAGGAMIVLMLLSLLATSVTGLAVYGAEEHAGPLAGALAGSGEAMAEAFEEAHEFLANFSVLLVIFHIAGVIVESLLHRENLVRAMFTGRKRLNT